MIKYPLIKTIFVILFLASFFAFVKFGLTKVPKPPSKLESRAIHTVEFSASLNPQNSQQEAEDIKKKKELLSREYPIFDIETLSIKVIPKFISKISGKETILIYGEDHKAELLRLIELVKESHFFSDQVVTVKEKNINVEKTPNQITLPFLPEDSLKDSTEQKDSYELVVEDKNIIFQATVPLTEIESNIVLKNLFQLIKIYDKN